MSRLWPALRENWARVAVSSGLILLLFGNQGFRSLASNWLELRRLRRESAALSAEEARLTERLKDAQSSDASLERMARKELGFIKKGEIEYRFPPPGRENQ